MTAPDPEVVALVERWQLREAEHHATIAAERSGRPDDPRSGVAARAALTWALGDLGLGDEIDEVELCWFPAGSSVRGWFKTSWDRTRIGLSSDLRGEECVRILFHECGHLYANRFGIVQNEFLADTIADALVGRWRKQGGG